jgi:hypothetical protein
MYYRNMRRQRPMNRGGYSRYNRSPSRRGGYGMRTQGYRPTYGARAGFARSRMTRRFTVGGSRW